MLKKLLRSNFFMNLLSLLAAGYLRFVRLTSIYIVDPPDAYDHIRKDWPMIFALWHSHLFLGPVLTYPKGTHTKFLVSRHRDGELVARLAKHFKLGVIRGSGSPSRQVASKGGASSFREMARALEEGASIGITADVPKTGFKVGRGVVALAQASGRPVYPIAMLTSRRYVFEKAWDRAAFPLPFNRLVFVTGTAVRVDANADEMTIEKTRREIEIELEKISARACFLADKAARTDE
jgi:lysophospholipid acyltransferase (LPLAT)-like uncharacterized protein